MENRNMPSHTAWLRGLTHTTCSWSQSVNHVTASQMEMETEHAPYVLSCWFTAYLPEWNWVKSRKSNVPSGADENITFDTRNLNQLQGTGYRTVKGNIRIKVFATKSSPHKSSVQASYRLEECTWAKNHNVYTVSTHNLEEEFVCWWIVQSVIFRRSETTERSFVHYRRTIPPESTCLILNQTHKWPTNMR